MTDGCVVLIFLLHLQTRRQLTLATKRQNVTTFAWHTTLVADNLWYLSKWRHFWHLPIWLHPKRLVWIHHWYCQQNLPRQTFLDILNTWPNQRGWDLYIRRRESLYQQQAAVNIVLPQYSPQLFTKDLVICFLQVDKICVDLVSSDERFRAMAVWKMIPFLIGSTYSRICYSHMAIITIEDKGRRIY